MHFCATYRYQNLNDLWRIRCLAGFIDAFTRCSATACFTVFRSSILWDSLIPILTRSFPYFRFPPTFAFVFTLPLTLTFTFALALAFAFAFAFLRMMPLISLHVALTSISTCRSSTFSQLAYSVCFANGIVEIWHVFILRARWIWRIRWSRRTIPIATRWCCTLTIWPWTCSFLLKIENKNGNYYFRAQFRNCENCLWQCNAMNIIISSMYYCEGTDLSVALIVISCVWWIGDTLIWRSMLWTTIVTLIGCWNIKFEISTQKWPENSIFNELRLLENFKNSLQ